MIFFDIFSQKDGGGRWRFSKKEVTLRYGCVPLALRPVTPDNSFLLCRK